MSFRVGFSPRGICFTDFFRSRLGCACVWLNCRALAPILFASRSSRRAGLSRRRSPLQSSVPSEVLMFVRIALLFALSISALAQSKLSPKWEELTAPDFVQAVHQSQ